ncbi:DUF423 domain-containing protein [Neolewinella litorea]|uniref:DUF423 domain-containing protein n=1 Tax=Neolewinella litorea TaxID=2562452 RepID=A0A4S4NQQ8_9BACT|nr:DUF423 domain-containing protein [Neolewinella litorea]THH41507.1 DUF423 domain-containing protein [Neolewinella litorea]
MNQSLLIRLTAILGLLSVALGAFGAHGLRQLVAVDQLAVFETGVRYQFYHTFALALAAVLLDRSGVRPERIRLAVWLWLAGLVLFSGSLYLLSLREVHGWPVAFLGPITPVGGLLLMGGWLALLLSPQNSHPHA